MPLAQKIDTPNRANLSEAALRIESHVLRAARELERLRWFASRISQEDTTESYIDRLCGQITGPGQREHTIAGLALSTDPQARRVLAEWTPPEELELFVRLALSTDATTLQELTEG